MVKCPHCDHPVMAVRISAVTGTAPPPNPDRKLLAYSCSHPPCGKVISIEMDPIALRSEIVASVLEGLHR